MVGLQRVEKALAARVDALVVLESLKRQQAVISALYSQLQAKERTGSMTNTDVRRMNRARSEVDQVEQAKQAAEGMLSLRKRRNARDVQWYRAGRAQQFCLMVLQLADAQAALQATLGDLWLGMASRTGAVTSGLGDDLAGLSLSDLGMKASASAMFVEPEPEEGEEATVASAPSADVPLPTEHAEAGAT